MIKFENFSKAYRSFVAVRDVSFTADVGRATVLLGENGAGKTTVLRACVGLHYATEGKVFVSDNNQSLDSESKNIFEVAENPACAKNLVGYVPETPVLYEDMTVAEFVANSALLHGIAKTDLKDAANYAMRLCGLFEVATQKIKTLSKGFKQRVSLAGVLAFDPPNIVLDEPTSGLDPVQISELRKIILQLAETKTVLLSTHIISEASALKPNILIMHECTVVASGNTEMLCKEANTPLLEDAFIFFTSRGVSS